MGFSIKLAPGVRIRASSRGIRTSVGPRIARVHVGGGRTGVSTGLGPVGFYTSLGGSSRRGGVSTNAASRSLTAAAKADQAQDLFAAIQAITDIHRQPFPPATRPQAPVVPVPELSRLIKAHRSNALAGISLFKRAARATAKHHADAAATAEHNAMLTQADVTRQQHQAALDDIWHRLCDNDPGTVLGVLAAAFEDNEAAAAPLGVSGSHASAVVQVPNPTVLPQRMPGVTDAGNLSIRKMTKRQTADLYKVLVSGYVLVTAREAFAVAPGLTEVAVVAVRLGSLDAYGARPTEAVMAARIARANLAGIRWDDADSPQIINEAAAELVTNQRGTTRELHPLDPALHPDLGPALTAVNLDVGPAREQ